MAAHFAVVLMRLFTAIYAVNKHPNHRMLRMLSG